MRACTSMHMHFYPGLGTLHRFLRGGRDGVAYEHYTGARESLSEFASTRFARARARVAPPPPPRSAKFAFSRADDAFHSFFPTNIIHKNAKFRRRSFVPPRSYRGSNHLSHFRPAPLYLTPSTPIPPRTLLLVVVLTPGAIHGDANASAGSRSIRGYNQNARRYARAFRG